MEKKIVLPVSNTTVASVSNSNNESAQKVPSASYLRLQAKIEAAAKARAKQAASKAAKAKPAAPKRVVEKQPEFTGRPERIGVCSPDMFDGKCSVVEARNGFYLLIPSLCKYVKLLEWHNPDYRNGEIKLFRRDDNGLKTICLMHFYTDGSRLLIGHFTVVKDKLCFTSGPALGTKYKGVMLVPKPVKPKDKPVQSEDSSEETSHKNRVA